MDFSEKPLMACFFFQDEDGILVVRRWWEGIEYFGLPGDEIPDGEDFEACARRILAPRKEGASDMAIVRLLGHYSHMGGSEDHAWNGHPVALNVFTFPDADIIAPMTTAGSRLSLGRIMRDPDIKLDVTIDVLRTVLRKRGVTPT